MIFSKKEAIIGIAGVGIGLITGYLIGKRKAETEYKKRLDDFLEQYDISDRAFDDSDDELDDEAIEIFDELDDDDELNPDIYLDDDMKPFLMNNEEYDTYVKKVQENNYQVEEDDEVKPEVTSDGAEEYQIDPDTVMDIKEEPKKTSKRPKVLGAQKLDQDDPETDFEAEDLYYFMNDDILVNESGEKVDEEQIIGLNPRRFGFMNGKGNLDSIWVRNYQTETDYFVERRNESVTDFFGTDEELKDAEGISAI